MKIRKLFLFLFYDVHKENMFTINLEDGREARYKASTLQMYRPTKGKLVGFIQRYFFKFPAVHCTLYTVQRTTNSCVLQSELMCCGGHKLNCGI